MMMNQNLSREALLWRQLNHPSLLPFIGIDKETFASTGFLCIVSPWMSRGTLKDYIKSSDYEPSRDQIRVVRVLILLSRVKC
jgi:serine/threonine protein kinase